MGHSYGIGIVPLLACFTNAHHMLDDFVKKEWDNDSLSIKGWSDTYHIEHFGRTISYGPPVHLGQYGNSEFKFSDIDLGWEVGKTVFQLIWFLISLLLPGWFGLASYGVTGWCTPRIHRLVEFRSEAWNSWLWNACLLQGRRLHIGWFCGIFEDGR